MKIYVVETLWSHEGDCTAIYGSGVGEVYANKADAIKRMGEVVEDISKAADLFDETGVRDWWEIEETETSWVAYEKDYFNHEYYAVFVEERDLK